MASSSSLSVPSEGKKGTGTDHSDLRTKNIFSPEVIDQGRCNCCWAIHAAELASALYNSQHEEKIHVKAGPQELIDYVHLRIPHDEKERPKIPDSMRCLTSSTNNGFKYMMRFGLSMEKDNPYQGKRICERKIPTPTQFAIQERTQKIPRFDIDNMSRKLWLTNFEKAKDKSEKDILEILKVQPIASAIKFTPELKMFTGKGVFNGNFTSDEKKMENEKGLEFQKKGGFVPKKDQGDKYHAVMIVGYGTDNGIDYYIIKNTWGKNWGDDGYANIRRDLCSISHTSWPVGAKLGSGLGTQSSS